MASTSSIIGTRRIIIFIDGTHLRNCLKTIFGNDNFNYIKFAKNMRTIRLQKFLLPELIRTYYYDAIPLKLSNETPKETKNREKEENYIKRIEYSFGYDVRLGRCVKNSKGNYRIKGINTLIAVDMISKAYENHYDIVILLAVDEEINEAIRVVKNTGKRIHGVFIKDYVIENLKNNFDNSVILSKNSLEGLRK